MNSVNESMRKAQYLDTLCGDIVFYLGLNGNENAKNKHNWHLIWNPSFVFHSFFVRSQKKDFLGVEDVNR